MAWFSRQPRAEVVVERGYVGPSFSAGDPALAQWLNLSGYNDAGVCVNEDTALGLTAVYRAVSLIAGTIAGLPLKTFRTDGDDARTQVSSFLDSPGGEWYTPFEWMETVVIFLLLWGNAPLLHVYNGAGGLVALFPVHPSLVTIERGPDLARTFTIHTAEGPVVYTEADMTLIAGPSVDGIKGMSPLNLSRNPLGTAIAGDKVAAKMFANGMMISGMVTSDETLTEADAKAIIAGLNAKTTGVANAGSLAVVNASLKFSPWSMNAVDGQMLESRQYQVNEVSRIFGVPVEMLSQTGASSWGTGLAELVKGWQKFSLASWTSRIEQRLSTLLPAPRHVEFELKGLLSGSPAEEVALIIQQVAAGVLTIDEARAIMNLPPLPEAAPVGSQDPTVLSDGLPGPGVG